MRSEILNQNFAWLPDPQQELLLLAALGEPEKAIKAWQEWKNTASFDELDAGSRRLLPLVYQNLQLCDYRDELTVRLKNEHRQTFRKNQLLFQKIEQLLPEFRKSGIRVMLLKGAPVSLLYYCSAALRPMSDIDLLVDMKNVPKAISLLQESGWGATESTENLELFLEIAPSCQFKTEDSYEVDLHWQVMRDCWNGHRSEIFWETAIELPFGADTVFALSPTHQLFHVCWHGARFNPVSPVRWVADAMMILRTSSDEIQWDEILRLSKLYRVRPAIHSSFKYLGERFGAPVPTDFLTKLHNASTTVLERMAFRFQAEKEPKWNFARVLRKLIFEYATLRSSTKLKPRSMIFVKYLKYHLTSGTFKKFRDV